MVAVPDASDDLRERKKNVTFVLATGSFGFLFLGLLSLLLSRDRLDTSSGVELAIAGAVGIALGIILIVAIIAVWFDKAWVGRWSD